MPAFLYAFDGSKLYLWDIYSSNGLNLPINNWNIIFFRRITFRFDFHQRNRDNLYLLVSFLSRCWMDCCGLFKINPCIASLLLKQKYVWSQRLELTARLWSSGFLHTKNLLALFYEVFFHPFKEKRGNFSCRIGITFTL